MASSLPIRCRCGKLEGVVSDITPRTGNHLVCYCDDCQLFQHFLEQAERVLDANGGTDIFQTSQGSLQFSKGREHLACMRLRPGGTVRWYAGCCNTPIGNTLATPAIPFIGIVTACLHDPEDNGSLAAAIGPVDSGVHGRFAYGDLHGLNAHAKAPLSLIWAFLGRTLRWRLRGDHKRSPLFDPSGELVTTPEVLGEKKLAHLKQDREALARQAG